MLTHTSFTTDYFSLFVSTGVTSSPNHIFSPVLSTLACALAICYVTAVPSATNTFTVTTETALAEYWRFLRIFCISVTQYLAVMLWLKNKKHNIGDNKDPYSYLRWEFVFSFPIKLKVRMLCHTPLHTKLLITCKPNEVFWFSTIANSK